MAHAPPTKYNSRHPQQVAVTDALVCFIAEDLLPLSVVDSTRFIKLLHTLDPKYQVPSRKHLSTILLKRKYDGVKNQILKRLQGVESINLTLDLWSNRQMKSFLGVTGHFISKEWKMESMMLACNRVTGRHTAENIASWYVEITSEYDIGAKVKHIVTDNASNVKKAFVTLPGFQQDQASDDEDDDDDAAEDYEVVDIVDDLSELETEHHGCFAHTLQLIVKDGLKKAGQIEHIIKKCSKLVSFLRKSTIATDVLNGEKRPQACNATRWNSQLKMIRSILTIPDRKLAEVEDAPRLTAHERNLLCDIVEILTPFEEATDFAQLENIPPAGYVLPCIRGLRHQLQNMISKYHSGFVRALKESFERRMPDYEHNITYIHAAILDPRFKLRWCRDEAEKRHLQRELTEEVEKIKSSQENGTRACAHQNTTDSEPPAKKKKELFSFMSEVSDAHATTSLSSTETQDYLDLPALAMSKNPATFWKDNNRKFPVLAKIAKDVLGVPASSAAVERLFSIAGKIFTPQRCRLTDKRFAQLMFIRCNNVHES